MKKVLGKGLESLIPQESADSALKEIKIDNIVPNKYQMRTSFIEEKIDELAESIKETGLVQPIIVTKNKNKYMLIAGERRWRAARKAGLDSVPCIERDAGNIDSLIVSLIENVQRENLSPVEEASAYENLTKEFSLTQEEIAKKVGRSRSAVANTMRILTLPKDLIELVDSGRLSAGHARALLSVKDASKREKLAQKIVREKLTVREAEKLAAAAGGKAKRTKSRAPAKDAEIEKMEEKFEKSLGTKVKINLKKNRSKSNPQVKGSVEIEFYSMEDFDRIAEVICGN